MNNTPETELDLSKLFLPDWVQQPPSVRHFVETGEEERAQRPPRRPRRERERRPPHRARATGKPAKPAKSVHLEREREKLPDIAVSFELNPVDVEVLAKQIKATARAYPVFEIARLVLEYPDRFLIRFSVKHNPDGTPVQPLFICALDETPWLSEDQIVTYVLDRYFNDFYQTERIPTEPPKGKYTFVAQCGLSGIILGPPNHHEYQSRLIRLHSERFSHMPFQEYKAHIRILRDEEAVKKWIEEQSWKTQYVCLNVPEPIRLESREAVEQHFRQVHLPNIAKQVESVAMPASKARNLDCKPLRRLARIAIIDQKQFPLQIVRALSTQLNSMGLQFFKVQNVTHVAIARPKYLDLELTPVSENVRRIIQFVVEHPGCTRKELIEALAPTPPPPPIPVQPESTSEQTEVKPTPTEPEPTPEQMVILAELHWLILQGHVVEFYNGRLDVAKKPKRPIQTHEAATPTPQEQSTPGTGTQSEAAENALAPVTNIEQANQTPTVPETPQSEPQTAHETQRTAGPAPETQDNAAPTA